MRTTRTHSRPTGARAADGRRHARPARASAPRAGKLALVGVLALALFAAAPALGDAGARLIDRCIHGQSLSGFSQSAYRQALQELPTEVEEYSNCGNLIRRAQLAAAGSGGVTQGAGSAALATPLTPTERQALARVPKTSAAPLQLGGQLVRPGTVHASIASAFSSLPDPLLAVLAFMLACALALAFRALRDRVRSRRSS